MFSYRCTKATDLTRYRSIIYHPVYFGYGCPWTSRPSKQREFAETSPPGRYSPSATPRNTRDAHTVQSMIRQSTKQHRPPFPSLLTPSRDPAHSLIPRRFQILRRLGVRA
ncbi:hypothetical protein HDV57DRAFT_289140 [Trichoderma longibrachiatum]